MSEKLPRFFLSAILIILAYEWLVSGLDKILSGAFFADMYYQVLYSIPNMQYEFYADLLQKYCIPHYEVMAAIVEVGEIAVGLSFGLLAYFVFKAQIDSGIAKLGVITSFISAFMTLNFFFYQGGAFFVDAQDQFNQGVSTNLIMALIQVVITAYFWAIVKSLKMRNQPSK